MTDHPHLKMRPPSTSPRESRPTRTDLRALEALAPAELAVHREALERLAAAGWRFRRASGPGFVAERGAARCFGSDLRALVAHLSSRSEDR